MQLLMPKIVPEVLNISASLLKRKKQVQFQILNMKRINQCVRIHKHTDECISIYMSEKEHLSNLQEQKA